MPSSAVTADVVLVQMPFATTAWPSLGLSLLKSELSALGVTCHIGYFTIAFERYIGQSAYEPTFPF
jgi:hypothetical protein